MFHWLRRVRRSFSRTPTSHRPIDRARLGLEALEDRSLPATGILFFGNGYTSANGLDTLVKQIAAAAGQTTPVTGTHTAAGATLLSHANAVTPADIAAMLPSGQSANFVVLQGNNLEAASQVGGHSMGPSYNNFRYGAGQLAADVVAAESNARIILFETWALPSGGDATPAVYPRIYAGQNLMQQDLRNGYKAAATDLETTYGAAKIDIAPVGDAFQLLGYSNVYQTANGAPSATGQASARGSLLSALTLYATMYEDNVSDIPYSAVSSFATGVTAADWKTLTSAADRAVGNGHLAQNQAYVTQLYKDILNRNPDTTGLNNLVSQLGSGALTRAGVAKALINTDEFRTNFIKSTYQTYLSRNPDAAAMSSLMTQLRNGVSLDTVRTGILSSKEYYQRQGGTNGAFVETLFSQVLQRAPTLEEKSNYVHALNTGTTRAAAITTLVNTLENRRRQVTNLYQTLLGRAPDATALQNLVTHLQAGMAFQAVIANIAGSGESYDRFAD